VAQDKDKESLLIS